MMKQSEDKKIEKLQTMIFTGILVAVFVLLIRLVLAGWVLLWFYYGLVQSACDAGRDNSKRVHAGADTSAVLDFPRRRKQWISVCVLWLLPPGYYS